MIVLIARYIVKPGNVDKVLTYLRDMKTLVDQSEPDCHQYQVAQSDDDSNILILLEQYSDAAALAAHCDMPHFKQIIEGKVVPLLENRLREFMTLAIA